MIDLRSHGQEQERWDWNTSIPLTALLSGLFPLASRWPAQSLPRHATIAVQASLTQTSMWAVPRGCSVVAPVLEAQRDGPQRDD